MGWISAILAVLAAGASVHQGEQQRAAGSKALRGQREAQKQATARATGQERLAAMADARANKKKPNIDSLLFSERARADMGAGSTLLAGRGGGGTPLLGSKSLMG